MCLLGLFKQTNIIQLLVIGYLILSYVCVHFSFWAEKDAFVLCRIFHKSNIGPPSGQRYAPFIEEEWDDDDYSVVVPGMNNGDKAGAGRNLAIAGNSQCAFAVGNNNQTSVERDANEKLVEGNTVIQVCFR